MSASHTGVGRDHAELAERIGATLEEADWVLVKGSRAMQMERIVAALIEEEIV
jgi:UDP-N-acetylmuramyl pentapeptide synthase